MQPLATIADYELLIGPVDPGDEPRLEYMLLVASAVVVGVAPGLMPWAMDPTDWPLDPDTGAPVDPTGGDPVPAPAVMVTCQVTANLMTDKTGTQGTVAMERVGLAETQYNAGGDTYGLLPGAWHLTLKAWRQPWVSLKLHVPHPSVGMHTYEWWWDQVPEEVTP